MRGHDPDMRLATRDGVGQHSPIRRPGHIPKKCRAFAWPDQPFGATELFQKYSQAVWFPRCDRHRSAVGMPRRTFVGSGLRKPGVAPALEVVNIDRSVPG